QKPPGRTIAEFGDQRMQHLRVIAALESARKHQRAAADEPQREFEFGGPVSGIDVDQYQSRARRREHRQHPFNAVRCPDTDALAGLESECQYPARGTLDLAIEFREGPSHRL